MTFLDNGIGLTEDEVHRFLATIGESSKKKDLWEQPMDFIGQFGIGLLSCFVVSDEIVVVTRSAQTGGRTLEWRGRPDGTYSLKTLDADLDPGTQVFLTCKAGFEDYFEEERVRDLVRHFGGLLPIPIRLTAGKRSAIITRGEVPWQERYTNERERSRALLAFGRGLFGIDFFDAIPLKATTGDVSGVAFILPFPPSLAARRTHRVYLKNMLLSQEADNLLPEWAFFVKAVVNANDLRPTASRESFYEDERLAEARTALGNCVRDYLIALSHRDQEKLQRLLALHHRSIKALAVHDDDFYRIFIDWLPFETSLGEMTLPEYRKRSATLRYVPDLDQFRQITRVAAAQGLCLLNGGYTYDTELLAKYPEIFPQVEAEVVDPAALTEAFHDLDLEEQEQVHDFLRMADAALQSFRCRVEVKRFLPKDVPALYNLDSEGRFLRSLEQSKEIADPLWGPVLGNIGRQRRPEGAHAQLFFNYDNPLVHRLVSVCNRQVLQRSVQLLYVQALLLGHHPLEAREMKLLNEGLLDLIGWGLESPGEGNP